MLEADHNEIVRREFAKQARSFGSPGLTLARQDYLRWVVKALPVHPGLCVLDVASGTGHLARAMAPHVREVIAIDATAEMLEEGRKEAERVGLSNVVFELGFAEHLPHGDRSFDMVVCRFAVHHFIDPPVPIGEMARICRPGGTVAVIDLVAPDDEGLAERYNRLEGMRDPSTTVVVSAEALGQFCVDAGLAVRRTDSRDVEVNVEQWLALTKTSKENADVIRREMRNELAGGETTGMRPFERDGQLMFRHRWAIVVAERTG